jgi:hypothetical protein
VKTRLVVSVLFGLIAAIGVTVFAGKYSHAALVADAARSGGHQTVASILIDGFIVVAVVVAVVVFVAGTVAAACGRARARRVAPQWSTAAPRRRRRAGAGW